MIRVTIIDDERIIKSVTEKSGDGILMAWAQENEKSPGYGIFSSTGEILEIKDTDDITELLVRSMLNSLDLKGVSRATCKNRELFKDLIRLGFKQNDDICEVDIKTFFKPCCNHK